MHRDSNRVRCAFFLFYRPNETEVRPTGKYRYLTFEDRKKIEAWHLIGDRPADIAARLSVHYTTIYKELQRGATGTLDRNQREGYSAELAERRLRESFKRRGRKRSQPSHSSVLPPQSNFIRKATVCLLSFIPICAESEAVGMVINMKGTQLFARWWNDGDCSRAGNHHKREGELP